MNRKPFISERLRSKRPQPQILMAPLIDIVFLLLIFFMLVTKFIPPSIAVALPESESGTVDESQARTVTVDAEGITFLDDIPMTLDEITNELAFNVEAGDIEVVRLRLDKEATAQHFLDALDAIKNAGIVNIAIETSQENSFPGIAKERLEIE